jgi:hypothetical protein
MITPADFFFGTHAFGEQCLGAEWSGKLQNPAVLAKTTGVPAQQCGGQ